MLIYNDFLIEILHGSIACQTLLNGDVLPKNKCRKDRGLKAALSPYFALLIPEKCGRWNYDKTLFRRLILDRTSAFQTVTMCFDTFRQ